MFGETLLESSPRARKGKRWPMATAFTVESLLAAVVVIVPLLSTGVIPLSARMQPPVQLQPIHVERVTPIHDNHTPTSGTAPAATRPTVVTLVSNNPSAIHWGRATDTTTDPDLAIGDPGPGPGPNGMPPNIGGGGTNVQPQQRRVVVSVLSQAQLVNRVEPVYPRIAVVSGVQGEVKLHAIIARDGRIISLNLISGHPLLAHAAEDAVSQWRYRPYILNGQPVEVETFITVHFTRDRQ